MRIGLVAAAVLLALELLGHLLLPALPSGAVLAVTLAAAGAIAGAAGVIALRRLDAHADVDVAESAARSRSILDAAVDGIIAIDETGVIESVNPATTSMFGYTPAELVGRNVRVLMPSPDREQHDGYLRRYLDTGEARIIGIGREVLGQRRDGTVFPIDLSVTEAVLGPRRLFTGILRDITERREAQAEVRRLGEMLEQSLSEIYTFDERSLRFAQVNRGARENLGYSLDELQKMSPLDIKPELSPEAFAALLEPLRTGARKSVDFKTSHLRRDGTTYRVDVHVQHAAAERGGHFIAVVHDVTEREELEARLSQAQKMEAVGQLAGGIAHDFNNLLTSIQGSGELLAARLDPDDRGQRAVRRIQQAAERGSALTQKLLAFSRQQVAQPEVMDLNAAVQQIAELATRLLADDIEVDVDLEPDAHPVEADPTHVDQVVLNLVVNAGDAMPRGGRLRIETCNVELDADGAARVRGPAGACVRLSVTDTGVGMDPAILERIFEPFFTTKDTGKGTGLGLATVYGIATQSGWGIEVDSVVGRGTAFRLYVPRAQRGVASRDTAVVPAGSAGAETLLLVEDDPLVRDMLTELLESAGYRLVVAETPGRALALAENLDGEIGLMLSDVVMPEMTGPELVERLRERWPGLRVLLISGHADDALESRGGLPAGIPFLAKPFGNDVLLRRIREVLDV